jgi:hypothetical protein
MQRLEDQTSVFKIFDNRFHPTYLKPSNWLGGTPTTPRPWLAGFNAVEHLRYEEGPTPDVIGSPNTKRKNMASGRDGIVPYFQGAVAPTLRGGIAEIIKAMHLQLSLMLSFPIMVTAGSSCSQLLF